MTYTVKKGDTLYGISKQFGVKAIDLANLNNVNASNLQIGTVLKIPTTSGNNPDSLVFYTVKKGDTLYSIAKKYNTSVSTIIDDNNLKNYNLSLGQELKIRTSDTTYLECINDNIETNYTVKKGDTLYSISKMFNESVESIKNKNNLTSNNLYIGQILKI